MTLLCAATDHTPPVCRPRLGLHKPGCPTSDCRGCLPQLAEDDEDGRYQVCRGCRLRTENDLHGLPEVWGDLLIPTRTVRGGGGTNLDDDGRRDTMAAIRACLVSWCLILEADWGIDAPGAYDHPADVPTMAAHVWDHSRSLLASEHAGQLVADITPMWQAAIRYAYPAPPAGYVIGTCPNPSTDPADTNPCGGQVRAVIDTNGDGWATCLTCDTGAVLSWWRDRMAAQTPDALGMRDLRWWLAIHHGVTIPEGTVKSWEHRGRLVTVPHPTTPGRVLYPVGAVVQLAMERRTRVRPRPPT